MQTADTAGSSTDAATEITWVKFEELLIDLGWKVGKDTSNNQVIAGPTTTSLKMTHVTELRRQFRELAEQGKIPKRTSVSWQWIKNSQEHKLARSTCAKYIAEVAVKDAEAAARNAKIAEEKAKTAEENATNLASEADASAWSEKPGGSFNEYGSEGPPAEDSSKLA